MGNNILLPVKLREEISCRLIHCLFSKYQSKKTIKMTLMTWTFIVVAMLVVIVHARPQGMVMWPEERREDAGNTLEIAHMYPDVLDAGANLVDIGGTIYDIQGQVKENGEDEEDANGDEQN